MIGTKALQGRNRLVGAGSSRPQAIAIEPFITHKIKVLHRPYGLIISEVA